MSHSVETFVGIGATAVGAISLGLLTFGPAVYTHSGGSAIRAGSLNLWSQGIDSANVRVFLVILIAAVVSVAVGSVMHSLGFGALGVPLLWAATVVLLGAALVTLPGNTTSIVPPALHSGTADSVGVGIYLFPAAVAALVAAVAGTISGAEPISAEAPGSR
jgi:hypothetical protein